jgi:hypothetical protein
VISAPHSEHFQLPFTMGRGEKPLSDFELSKSMIISFAFNEKATFFR